MLAYSQVPWALGLHKLLLDYADDLIVSGYKASSVIDHTLNMGSVSNNYYYSVTVHTSPTSKYVLFEVVDTDVQHVIFKIKIGKMHEYPYGSEPCMICTTAEADWFDHLWMAHFIDPDGVVSNNNSTCGSSFDIISEFELRPYTANMENTYLKYPISEDAHFQKSLLYDMKEYEYFKMLENYCLEFRSHPFSSTFEFPEQDSGNNYMETLILSFPQNDEKILDDVQDYVYNTFKSKLVELFGER